jgi:hypothetical protein
MGPISHALKPLKLWVLSRFIPSIITVSCYSNGKLTNTDTHLAQPNLSIRAVKALAKSSQGDPQLDSYDTLNIYILIQLPIWVSIKVQEPSIAVG